MTPHWTANFPADACREAVKWCRQFATPQAAWDACDRSDQMIWLVFRLAGGFGSTSHRRACGVLGAIVKSALDYVPAGEHSLAAAIRLVERYASGEEITREELEGAYIDALAAADATAAVAFAADAAARAADATTNTFDALDAAYAGQCNAIRRHMPEAPKLGG
jgi:hypothetical protein